MRRENLACGPDPRAPVTRPKGAFSASGDSSGSSLLAVPAEGGPALIVASSALGLQSQASGGNRLAKGNGSVLEFWGREETLGAWNKKAA